MALLVYHISRTVAFLEKEIALEILVLCLGLDTGRLQMVWDISLSVFLFFFFDKWLAIYCCKLN